MDKDETLDNLVRKAEKLRVVNRVTLLAQLPIAILTHTPSGLENYINSKTAAFIMVGVGVATGITAGITLLQDKYKSLVDNGIYGIVRHPTYLGFRLASLGLVAYNPSIENLIAGTALFLTTEFTARAEEKKLEYIYPTEYSHYKEKVPRWVPYANRIKHFFAGITGRA